MFICSFVFLYVLPGSYCREGAQSSEFRAHRFETSLPLSIRCLANTRKYPWPLMRCGMSASKHASSLIEALRGDR